MSSKWIAGARPRTLPAAISPVVVGTALAYRLDKEISYANAFLALLVSLSLQVAVNYANDYSDGIKGTDEKRVGPVRLVGSGLASAAAVKRAAFIAFGFAAIAGTLLSIRTSYILILVGLISIAAAWTYTGSNKPYGYRGFGEISVFVFFGIIATVGTFYAATERVVWQAFLLSIPVGAMSCALLAINNLRDLPKDDVVGKKTLAVVMGDKSTRDLYKWLMFFALVMSVALSFFSFFYLLALISLPLVSKSVRSVSAGASGPALIELLAKTGRIQIIYAVALSFAAWLVAR